MKEARFEFSLNEREMEIVKKCTQKEKESLLVQLEQAQRKNDAGVHRLTRLIEEISALQYKMIVMCNSNRN